MSTLRLVTSSARRTVGVVQDLTLLLAPHGGQAAARANALRAVSRDSEQARQRRRAQAAVLAALSRHPVTARRA